MRPALPASLLLAAVAAAPLGSASANERHFTYTYESAVLPAGGRELELWTTPRIGRRDGFFARFDQRMELEVGVTDRLLTAFYLNFKSVTEEVADQELATSFEFGGVSSEWKLKLMDPVADAVGLGLYFEVTGSTNEFELEGKVILDKRIGNVLLAFDAVVEQEWELETASETKSELVLEADLGAAYFVLPSLSIGLEIRQHTELVNGEREHSALFAGPVIAYAQRDWWTAVTFMPQLGSFGEGGMSLDLHEHERFNARLLFSVHL
jgi:hypothetical protein